MLKLKQGAAILLKDVLKNALSETESSSYDDENKKVLLYNGRNALKEFGVVQLSCEEARTILNLRCDYVDLN